MANEHLTNDNGVAAFGNVQNHLGGVSTNQYGDHLVVVKQITNWYNKQFVITPTEIKYNQGWSCGLEEYSSVQGGMQVYNDTNTLIDNVKNSINTHNWKSGPCALFAISSRTGGPYAWYQYYNHFEPTMPVPNSLSEYGASVVAYKFNLKHLHLSKMPGTFTAYVRVWSPSIVVSYPPMDNAVDGILINGGLYNNGSCLMVKLFSQLPAISWNVSDAGDSFEFANNCNNGTIVYQDTILRNKMVNYSPFGGQMSYSSNGNSSRIFTLQDNMSYPQPSPTNFYHDFQISNQDNLDFLMTNPGELWLVAHFHMGNAFSQGSNNNDKGLAPTHAVTVFSERVELVLQCTSQSFNN